MGEEPALAGVSNHGHSRDIRTKNPSSWAFPTSLACSANAGIGARK
jgi:hypothetical protein